MNQLKIHTGKAGGALKVVVYGPEGIGKSTLAAHFPRPVFIDTEGSTRHMDVSRTDKPSSWTMLMEQVQYVRSDPGVCSTLVIDTADWAEQLCIASICADKKLSGIEDMGYGKGYVYLAEEFGRLLNLLEEIVGRGVHVVLTAHAMMRKFEQPDEMGAYDRWELKLSKKVAPLVKEWADLLLFANYEVITLTDTNSKRKTATGGERVMYATHHPCWDAKNRHGLPDKLPFAWAAIAQIFEAAPAVSEPAQPQKPVKEEPQPAKAAYGETPISELPAALAALMFEYNVTEAELQRVVADRGYFPADTPILNYGEDFINGKLVACWPQVFRLIEQKRSPGMSG